jgi:hypothetical protein
MNKPMMINDNGVTRPMTEEEIKAYEGLAEQMPKPEPTPEERIAALEEQLRAAKILLGVE